MGLTWSAPAKWPAGFDPYMGWAAASRGQGLLKLPGQTDTDPDTALSVIVKLKRGQALDDLAAYLEQVPAVYHDHLPGTEYRTRIVTGIVRKSNLKFLIDSVEACEVGLSRLPHQAVDAVASAEADIVDATQTPTLVVGVIDDGCAFLRDEFADPKKANGTRILALWDQSSELSEVPPWQPVTGLGYGRMLTKGQIDALRNEARVDGTSHAAIYARLGHVVMVASDVRAATHGTSVLGLAAATEDPVKKPYDPSVGQQGESQADIVFVHVPPATSRDTSGGGLPVHMLDGLRFILAQAGGKCRVVVNISYGGLAGPHDGSSLIEQAMDEILEHRPATAIVIAAGNGNESHCQVRGALEPGQEVTLPWDVKEGDATDSFCEVWLRSDGKDAPKVNLRLGSPPGWGLPTESPMIPTGKACYLGTKGSGERGAIAAIINAAQVPNGQDPMILLALGPVDPSPGSTRTPHGTWRIVLKNEDKVQVAWSAYIERDDAAPSVSKSGVQSQFIMDSLTRGDTLNSLSTGHWPIVVGGVCETKASDGAPQLTMAAYSGIGPSRGDRTGPDAVAVCELGAARSLPSVPFLGSTPSSIDRTSAATAVVTRWIANWMKNQYPSPNAADVRTAVRATTPGLDGVPVASFEGLRLLPSGDASGRVTSAAAATSTDAAASRLSTRSLRA